MTYPMRILTVFLVASQTHAICNWQIKGNDVQVANEDHNVFLSMAMVLRSLIELIQAKPTVNKKDA